MVFVLLIAVISFLLGTVSMGLINAASDTTDAQDRYQMNAEADDDRDDKKQDTDRDDDDDDDKNDRDERDDDRYTRPQKR